MMLTADYTKKRLNICLNTNVLFSLHNPLDTSHNFMLMGYNILMSDLYGNTVLYRAKDEDEAREVMTFLSNTLLNMHRDPELCEPSNFRLSTKAKILALAVVATAAALILATTWTSGEITGMEYNASQELPETEITHIIPGPVQHVASLSDNAPDRDQVKQPTSAIPPTLSPEDFRAAQAALAAHLKRAAEKKLFTISLSSGHPHTLYVFADPDCQNCRVFEPTLQALSGSANIEIFPVTLVGKDDTARKVVPLLCAPAEARAVLWRNLFDVGAGMLNLNQTTKALPDCQSGQSALARNDRAMSLFHLPGTPTVIADDGRMVPFLAMKSAKALNAFFSGKP